MTKISPTNNHLLIEPVKHEEFIATQRDTYEEIGVVVAVAPELGERYEPAKYLGGELQHFTRKVSVGDKVYFDSWLAAKYPKEGTTDQFYWLVKWEDVRAVEYVE